MLYTYKKEIKIGKNEMVFLTGIKESKLTAFLEKFAYIAEWFSVGFLFYLNTILIHSRLFSIFVFSLGILLLFTTKNEKKLTSKQEFLDKVNEILEDEK